jgi:hypothetical protein
MRVGLEAMAKFEEQRQQRDRGFEGLGREADFSTSLRFGRNDDACRCAAVEMTMVCRCALGSMANVQGWE